MKGCHGEVLHYSVGVTARLGEEALFQCAILRKSEIRGGSGVWTDDSQCVGAGKIDVHSLDPQAFYFMLH